MTTCKDCIFSFEKNGRVYCDWYDIVIPHIDTICEYYREVA